MDYSRLDIEARIRDANRLRSIALGNLIVDGWRGFVQLLAGLLPRRPCGNSVVVDPAASH